MAGSRSAASELAPAAEPRLIGRVEHEGHSLALALTCASRLALGVHFGAVRVADGTVFPGLDVEVEGGTLRLGRCRFAALGGERRVEGRLVFLDDVYDCRSLVLERRFTDLRGFFRNLPLVIAQRERVRPEFERWVAALVYDLSVHRRFLDDQDRIIDEEPADVAAAARWSRARGAASSPSSTRRTASSTRSSPGSPRRSTSGTGSTCAEWCGTSSSGRRSTAART